MQFTFDFDTKASPEQVKAALTDFSDRRTEIWKDTLDPDKYEVREVGDTWAVAREGSKRPSVWAVERYDWSEPGKVSWTVEESNFCKPGSGVQVKIQSATNGGSHVAGQWHRTPAGLKGNIIIAMTRFVGPTMISKYMREALDRYAEAQSPAS